MTEYKIRALKLQQLMLGMEIEEFLDAKKKGKIEELLHPEDYYIKIAQVWEYLGKSITYLNSAGKAACKNKKPFDN